jgi:hypothetical protein
LNASALDVAQQVLQPADQVLALLVDGRLQNLGVGRGIVGGRQRLDVVAGQEFKLAAFMRAQPLGVVETLLQPVAGHQIGLL